MGNHVASVLMLAIVQHDDADAATRALTEAGLRATRISSTGGFLGSGNVTLLLGIEQSAVAKALTLLGQTCRTRTMYLNAGLPGGGVPLVAEPIEAEVGGAIVFVLAVERMLRLGGRPSEKDITPSQEAKPGTKLIVSITSESLSQTMLPALAKAQYRATQISTSGGFLRRGNATLLIGVEQANVDDVLQRISTVCAQAPQPNGNMANATIFVLAVATHLRV